MPLDKIARRYAEQLFVQKLEKIARDHDERLVAIRRDFARRGGIQSGAYISTLAQVGIARVEDMARARTDSLLSAHTKSRVPLSDQVVEEILAQVIPLCETQKQSLITMMGETIRHTFGPTAPGGFQGALGGEIETGVSRIVADIRRELGIRRDEAILEARQATSPTDEKVSGEWDVFICHASEDKKEFVNPLAEALLAKNLRVWYDDFVLNVGDSLRQSIDHGLARSRYGIVVLSPHFFEKDWPQKELDGLVAKETGREKVILPVWHKVGFEDVRRYSPTLAGRVAAKSSEGLDAVVAKLLRAVGVSAGASQPAISPAVEAKVQEVSDERFRLVIEDYERRGTPKHMIDTLDDLSQEGKAVLYERAIRWKKGKPPKSNPYREG